MTGTATRSHETSSRTDWWDEITRTGITQDHNLTISGGNDGCRHRRRLPGPAGVLVYNDFQGRLTSGRTAASRIDKRFQGSEKPQHRQKIGCQQPAQSEQGTISQVYKIARSFPGFATSEPPPTATENAIPSAGPKQPTPVTPTTPFAELFRQQNNWNRTLNILGNVYAELEIIDGLKFKSTYNVDMNNFNNRSFVQNA